MRWRPWQGLGRRVLLASAVCAFMTVIPVMFVTALYTSDAAVRAQLGADRPGVLAATAACLEVGGRWTQAQGDGTQGYFYDARSGASLYPDAPALWPELFARIQAGEPSAGGVNLFFPEPGGQAVVRTRAPDGPCAVLAIHWTPFTGARIGLLQRVWVTAVGLLAMAIFGTQLLAVRPLLRRLERLERSARSVGDAGFAPAPGGPDDAIDAVGRSLVRAHDRIQRTEEALHARRRALERHVSDIAHDLRTPLAGIQLILEEIAAGSEAPQRRAGDALDDLVYLAALTENLREAARLAEGVHPLAGAPEVDLCGVVRRVEGRFRTIGRARGVEVAAAYPDLSVKVVCDPSMAERVVANLVSNAVAVGREGGHVAIALERLGEGFELTVLDDGPGIPTEVLERVGQRHLGAVRPRRGGRPGAGLGLAIVHEVCNKAKWSLRFEPLNEAGGARVIISGPSTG